MGRASDTPGQEGAELVTMTYRITWDAWPPGAHEPKRGVAYHHDAAMAREQLAGLRRLKAPDDCPAATGKGPCAEHVWHILADQRETVASEWDTMPETGEPDDPT
jgi:hypothetical protein